MSPLRSFVLSALRNAVDLPDARLPEQPGWETRRAMAADWWRQLRDGRERWGFETVGSYTFLLGSDEQTDLIMVKPDLDPAG